MKNKHKINLNKFPISSSLICSIIISSCAQQYTTHIEPTYVESKITDITHFKKIESTVMIDKNTLVLVDIDDTIITSTTHYGSVEFFKKIVRNNAINKNISHEESIIDIYPRWLLSQRIVETELTDKYIHRILDNKKATILGFTARQLIASDIT